MTGDPTTFRPSFAGANLGNAGVPYCGPGFGVGEPTIGTPNPDQATLSIQRDRAMALVTEVIHFLSTNLASGQIQGTVPEATVAIQDWIARWKARLDELQAP